MWSHIMKEVKAGRYAGPFETVPFEHFIQSPIGLVPKDGGTKTRLIFHLSYVFKNGNLSVNDYIPKDACSVKYNDLDDAVANALYLKSQGAINLFMAKTDLKAAFRGLPIFGEDWPLLVMKAEDPVTGKVMFFIDKCLPFGASISCSHFQRFSNSLKHLVVCRIGIQRSITNYLDDYLFLAATIWQCNKLVAMFLVICEKINFPVALDKTFWADVRMVFLGILLDGRTSRLCIPEEKRLKAMNMLQKILSKKKVMVKDLQRLTGLLNFLCKVIHPGRTFTRRMYNKYSAPLDKKGRKLKHYHHITIDAEFQRDCEVWQLFLNNAESSVLTRPFVDFENSRFTFSADTIQFTTDASANEVLGFGCYFQGEWSFGQWEQGFVKNNSPSIEYLELYALLVGVFIRQRKLVNGRYVIFCDNEAVVHMVNAGVSKCSQCMYLLRMLTLNNLLYNRRIFVKHITSRNNYLSDCLSSLKIDQFFKLAPPSISRLPEKLPEELWPLSRLWQKRLK